MVRDTDMLGGVSATPEELAAMHQSQYVLHARGGRLEKVPAEKIRLPPDPQGHVQRLCLVAAPDGTLYAAQHTLISRSTDGGRTWEHLQRDPSPFGGWRLQFTPEGTMLNIAGAPPHAVWASEDEGETWERIGAVDAPASGTTEIGFSVTRLADGTLLVPVLSREAQTSEDYSRVLSGAHTCYTCCSADGGRTFPSCSVLGDWCHEGNVVSLSSGRLLAVVRYQRGHLPDDPPDLSERTGAVRFGSGFPYKHVFLADSEDGGRTWTEPRQLTTVFGQCYGSGVGLADDCAVVVHDHRYPREVSSARAMVSRDRGQTWEDEVYYLNHGVVAGYAATVSLDGEEMFTLAGSAYGNAAEAWENCVGNTDFALIRWQLA